MVGQTYHETFWGGDISSTAGFEALSKRNYEGKKMCQELEEYLKKRSKLESDYSKTLAGLAKCFKFRDNPEGTLEATLNKLKVEIDTMANSHQGACVFFSQQADSIKRFREEQTMKKKQKEECVQKSQNAKLSQLSKTRQLEKSYYKKCSDRDAAAAAARDIERENPSPPQKEIEKVKNRAAKAEEEVQKADNVYRSAVIVLEDTRGSWEREMTSLCEVTQDLDEKRVQFLRNEIWTCLNVDSKLALDIDNSCENVRLKLEKCSISDDIQSFIQNTTTGSVRPDQFRYKPYGQALSSTDNNLSSYQNVDVDVIMKKRELPPIRK